MLNPPASTTSPDSHTATGPFYSSVDLTLTGTVHPGDVWTLGVGNRDLTDDTSVHTADTTLQAIANRLGSELGSPYTYSVTVTSGGAIVLHIANSAGFSLNGSTLNLSGLQQTAAPTANTVTRTTTAADASGNPLTFSSAQVTVVTAAAGETWTITAGSYHSDPYAAQSTDRDRRREPPRDEPRGGARLGGDGDRVERRRHDHGDVGVHRLGLDRGLEPDRDRVDRGDAVARHAGAARSSGRARR